MKNTIIDTVLFLQEWSKIQEKLEAISNIPKKDGDGKYFEGLDIDEEGVTYKSSTSYSGCGTDNYDFHVNWDEINNPIEYFKEKYSKEIQDDKERKIRLKEEEAQKQEERERKEFERLSKKFTI